MRIDCDYIKYQLSTMNIKFKEAIYTLLRILFHYPLSRIIPKKKINYHYSTTTTIINGDKACGTFITAYIANSQKVMGKVWLMRGHFSTPTYEYCIFYSLWVHPTVRRLGMGNKLMQELYCYAKKEGYKEIFLITRQKNTKAINFYIKNGYQPHTSSLLSEEYQKEIESYYEHQTMGFFIKIELI